MATIREQVADRLTGGQLTALAETVTDLSNNRFVLQESIAQLEAALYSDEWRRVQAGADMEFTRDGIRQITELSRLMRLKNPVIKRAVEIQRLYVWAQGMTVRAGDERVQDVVDGFLDDERNRATVVGHQARGELEEDLQTDGNLFIRFFPDAISGRVRVAVIDPQQIDEIIANPEDNAEPWFYKRTYFRRELNGNVHAMTEYYPDWRYNPRNKSGVPAGWNVDWATPVMHVAVNRHGLWGIPEHYAGLDWALAYKSFLENLASVWQALARFAWKMNVRGGATGVAAAKAKLGTTLGNAGGETNPPPLAGSTFIGAENAVDLQPFRTGGATMNAEDGRRLFLMAIASSGFPETFFGDVSIGTLATAESLDRPTELKIRDRQSLWADVFRDIIRYALLWAARAPQGKLRGVARVIREPDGGEWAYRLEWPDGVDGAVRVDFPPIVDIDVKEHIEALTTATTLNGFPAAGTLDLKTFTRAAAQVLGFDDVDSLIDELFPPEDEEAARDEQAAGEEERAAVVQAAEALMRELTEVVRGNGHST